MIEILRKTMNKACLIFSSAISVIGYITSDICFKSGLKSRLVFSAGIFVITYIVSYMMVVHAGRNVRAYFEQLRIGKFKGLWKGEALAKELESDFKDASNIDIKVTRGTELFSVNGNGQIVRYLEKLLDSATGDKEVRCRFLLIAPCYNIRHVRERHEIHQNQYETPEKFMGTWYETVRMIDGIGNGKSNVNFQTEVRFYTGRHSNWRFYILESADRQKKTILFSEYDTFKREHGSALPMYKVMKDDHNIGGFMARYFDEIWETSITREQLKRLVKTKDCIRMFCEACDTEKGDTKPCPCPGMNCGYSEACMKFAESL